MVCAGLCPVVMVDCATYRPMLRDSPCRRYNLWSQNYISDTGMWSQCNRKFGLNWRKFNLNCGQPYLPESSTSIARRRESGDHIWPQCSRKQLNSPPKLSGDHISGRSAPANNSTARRSHQATIYLAAVLPQGGEAGTAWQKMRERERTAA